MVEVVVEEAEVVEAEVVEVLRQVLEVRVLGPVAEL
jgi:hypothetical protein